ncbi:restriction endonuclease subunit S [Vibrio ostreicida]|uniref:restriction endonuclease subunit S n=1 Tax=Vibrio ostreicida TaxID=526588 RepID=UPI000970E093|nr:restriction endonuclease subunit S [Vibrio ostreicida]
MILENVALSKLVDIKGGGTPSKANSEYWNGSIPWASVKDFKSSGLNGASDYITQEGIDKSATSLIPRGNLIVPTRMALGKVAINSVDIAINQDLKALIIKDESVVDTEYLFRCIQSKSEEIVRQGKGATVKGITVDVLKNLQIPLPSLETQQQIAEVLEKADQLRKDSQQMEKELNSLAQSVFIELFGDPATNPKGWELTYLPNHGSFKNGLNFSKDDSGVRLKYLGVGDFKSLSSIRELDHLGFVDVNSLPADDYLLKNGDLVFVRSNGNKALVGRCISIYPDDVPVTFSGFCIRYRVESDSMEPEWLNYMLRTASMKQAMLEGGQGANIQNINQKILSSLEIPLPPIDKQRLFCKTIESYRESLFQLNEYSQQLNDLFNSLMQKAFKGELNL